MTKEKLAIKLAIDIMERNVSKYINHGIYEVSDTDGAVHVEFAEAINILNEMLEQQPTKEEKALLQKWHNNRGISMKDFEDAMDALEKEPCPYWDYGLNTCRHANIGALATITPNGVLEKIRAEIVDLGQRTMNDNRASGIWACRDIIDKYKDKGVEE